MTRTFADQDASDAAARRRLRVLAVVLFTLLVCSLAISAALWVALRRAREDRATAASADLKPAVASRPAPAAEAPPAPPSTAVTATPAPPPPAAAAPAEDRLLILISVGTRHYAEKQLRLLRQRCRAPLAIYLQRRGRCGWSQCFAVAAREADLDLARSCGATKGKSMRERADFVLIQ